MLILGDSYGWVPEDGPHAGKGKSVAESEYDHARHLELPILAFAKYQSDTTPRGTEEAERCDAFRNHVGDWKSGSFRAEFELADDLADKVGRSVIGLLTREFTGRPRIRMAAAPRTPGPPTAPPALPPALVSRVAERSAVLLIGAGTSLAAGLPTAFAFATALEARLIEHDPRYRPPGVGSRPTAIATDTELLLGPTELTDLAVSLVAPHFQVEPTEAHHIAQRLFDTVLTTNWDRLLERAALTSFRVIAGEASDEQLAAPRRLIKLHGTADDPESLVLTEAAHARWSRERPALRAGIVEMLSEHRLVSVGSSLRDPSVIELLEDIPDLSGWAVLPGITVAERRRLERWGLIAIDTDANTFFRALDAAVA